MSNPYLFGGIDLDAMTDEEFTAFLNDQQEARERAMTPDDHWRKAYQAEQRRKREVGQQDDLFGAKPTMHYHRNRPAPDFPRPPIEGIAEKLARIEGDPLATFGPPRSDRPAFLSKDQEAELVRGAANWLRVGQRVRLVDGSTPIAPEFGNYRYIGREGVVWRLGVAPFEHHIYVYFDPVGGERVDKIAFVELRDIIPVE